MGIVVQKYGGSSVATPELKAVARRVVETCDDGHRVVVVVSAMGNTTNELLALARSVANPQQRELDMLVAWVSAFLWRCSPWPSMILAGQLCPSQALKWHHHDG